MEPTDLGVRLAVGVPGAGKTYSIRIEILQAARVMPVIVIDRVYEWRRKPYNRVPPDLRDVTRYARTVDQATQQIAKGMRLVIVNPEDTEAEAEAACRWARTTPGPTGVVVHEAHNAFPNGSKLSPYAMDCATAWRHFEVAMWLDTQRLALLNRTWDLAGQIRLFAAADADRKVIRDIGGTELEQAVLEAGLRLAPRKDGGRDEPGWHVCLGTIRRAPYRLTRERLA